MLTIPRADYPATQLATNVRQVPTDPHAEMYTLGSLIIDRDAIIHVSGWLKSADFYDDRHAAIYEAILSLYNRREPPDVGTLESELRRVGKLEMIGGLAYIVGLAAYPPTSVHVEYYARSVERAAFMRRLIQLGGQIAALGYREDMDTARLSADAETMLFSVTQQRRGLGYSDMSVAANEYYDWMHRPIPDSGIDGFPTGITELDIETGGYQPGEHVVIAGPSSSGKSGLGFTIAYNAARLFGKRVGIFTLELARLQLTRRMLAMETHIPLGDLRRRNYGDRGARRVSEALGEISSLPIFTADVAELTPQTLKSIAMKMVAEQGVDALIIDQLSYMHSENKDIREQEVAACSRAVKEVARDCGVVTFLMAQTNSSQWTRADHVPNQNDLRESRGVYHDADFVLFVHRPIMFDNAADPEDATIYMGKGRETEAGKAIPVRWVAPETRFADQ